jgi:signal transduction histidine kinase
VASLLLAWVVLRDLAFEQTRCTRLRILDAMSRAVGAEGGHKRLIAAIQELSLARDLEGVQHVVRRVARELTGADGATFVLRDDGHCFYADEDAIEPLWKGKRFPMQACISGWAMRHRESVVIPDIYADARIPTDAYRPTFVKSLAMVPIRQKEPIGAIGTYWATTRTVTDAELELLQALADSTSIAMENVRILAELEARVRARTLQLEAANRELEAFSYSVSHDLRAPLRSIDGFGRALEEDLGDDLDAGARGHLVRIRSATARMNALIDDMLALASVSRGELHEATLDLTEIGRAIADDLARQAGDRAVEFHVAPALTARGDASLVRAVLENLLGNAFKFTGRVAAAKIELGSRRANGETVFFVRDNGAGFEMKFASKLFAPFQRLHSKEEFPGTGVGLATVQRIVHRHGGRIEVDSTPDEGTTFTFTLAPPPALATS